MSRNTLKSLKEFPIGAIQTGQFYSLPSLAAIKPNPLSVKRLILPFIVAIVASLVHRLS